MSSAETVIRETNSSHLPPLDEATPPQRLSLLDRMDPSIGEASAGIGALLTELVRRSLRGGVSNIDHHLTSFSEEQVQVALERQLPLVRDVATEIADATSREITQLAVAQLTEETAAKSEEMMTALRETDGRLRQAVTDVDLRVHHSIEETGRKFTEAIGQTESQLKEAAATISTSVARLEQETRQTTTQLAETITVSKQETVSQIESFQQELRDKSKRSWEKVQTQLDDIRGETAAIPQVIDRISQVERSHQHLATQHSQGQSDLLAQIGKLEAQLHATLEKCTQFAHRLEELERPRGISGWFQRLRGGGKKLTSPEEDTDQPSS